MLMYLILFEIISKLTQILLNGLTMNQPINFKTRDWLFLERNEQMV